MYSSQHSQQWASAEEIEKAAGAVSFYGILYVYAENGLQKENVTHHKR